MNERRCSVLDGEWLKWLGAAGLALGLAWAASGSVGKAAPSDPWLVENGTVRLLRIAGHGYAVPLGYIDAPLEPGLDQDGLYLKMLWPGLEPKTQENLREFTHVPGWGRRVSLLIQENRFKSSDHVLLQSELRAMTWPSYRLDFIDIKHNLNQFEFLYTTQKRAEKFDFFIDGSPEITRLFIRCSRAESVPKPGCNLVFVNDHNRMKISFERSYLPEWRNMQYSILQLLRQFSDKYAKLSEME